VIGPVGVGVGVADVIVELPVPEGILVVLVEVVGRGRLPLIAYMLSLLGPPQYSVVLPPQSIEQPFVAGVVLV
jgi:hypothetical protein